MKKIVLGVIFAILIASPVFADYENDLWYLSRVIQAEAGYCERQMQEYVGSVVLNRVEDGRFPNTIEGVVTQTDPCIQYSTYTSLASQEPTNQVIEVAKDLLENGSKLPVDVIYQANDILGPVYTSLSTSYSTMYFCIG